MKKSEKRLISAVLPIIVAFLCIVLLVLTLTLIYMIRQSNSAPSDGFSFDKLTSSEDTVQIDVTPYLIPEFIGITADGERLALYGSQNVLTELYLIVSPLLSELFSEENMTPADQGRWEECVERESSIYMQYRTAFPDTVIGAFADAASNTETERNTVNAYVYELFLGVYSDEDDTVTAVTRSTDGEVAVFSLKSPSDPITEIELGRFVKTYRSALYEFEFAKDNYPSLSYTEPIIRGNISARQILITDKTADFSEINPSDLNKLLKIFSVNPDKLQNKYTDAEGTVNYVGTAGVFSVGESSFEYKSTSETGLSCRDLIGGTGPLYVSEYIRAAVFLITSIENVNKFYAGGDAQLYLSSVSSSAGAVEICFGYMFNSIQIADTEGFFTVTFKNGMLSSAHLYTISVKNLGDRCSTFDERIFVKSLPENIDVRTVGLRYKFHVYESDIKSDTVFPEWCAEYTEKRDTNAQRTAGGKR